jgi:rod shape-determining protein MreD
VKYTRPAFVIFIVLVVQTSLVANLDVFGVRGDVMLLVPIAAGLSGGRDRGAIVGFASGLALDLVVHGTPAGFFALGYTLVGYIVGVAQGTLLRTAWWIPVLTALAGSALGVVILATLGKVIGLEGLFDRRLLTIAAVVAVMNGLLVLPMMRLVRWAIPPLSRSGRLVPS